MIALDTQILVHAHLRASEYHVPAAGVVRSLAEGEHVWALPAPVLAEFYCVATHRGIYATPSTPAQAAAQVAAWLSAPSVRVLMDGGERWPTLAGLLTAARLRGPRVYDAKIAAICIDNGVRELWTADKDYSSFPALVTRNPLLDS